MIVLGSSTDEDDEIMGADDYLMSCFEAPKMEEVDCEA